MAISYAFRKLAEHLRVAGLAGAGGVYFLAAQQGGPEASLIGATMAVILWGAAVLVALLLDFIFGDE